jgi:RNA polymerase sigma-70 factor (ECF subfamily)
MRAGASYHQADDAVALAMEEVLRRWGEITEAFAYARIAAVHNFIKAKTRDKDRRHLGGDCDHGPELDAACEASARALNVWEDRQWVGQLLASLLPAQRAEMTWIVNGFSSTEIATLLGKTPDAVRQNLHLARQRLRQHEDLADLHINDMASTPREGAR